MPVPISTTESENQARLSWPSTRPLMLSNGNRMPRATITVILVLQSVAASIYFDESMKTIIS